MLPLAPEEPVGPVKSHESTTPFTPARTRSLETIEQIEREIELDGPSEGSGVLPPLPPLTPSPPHTSRAPSPISLNNGSSPSSSEDEYYVINSHTVTMSDKKVVMVQMSGPKNPPILTLGTITPKIVSIFHRQYLHHILAKGIDADKQVQTTAAGFQNNLIQT